MMVMMIKMINNAIDVVIAMIVNTMLNYKNSLVQIEHNTFQDFRNIKPNNSVCRSIFSALFDVLLLTIFSFIIFFSLLVHCSLVNPAQCSFNSHLFLSFVQFSHFFPLRFARFTKKQNHLRSILAGLYTPWI